MPTDLSFDHLARLTTATGLYEHACGTVPRIEHGMCTDDVARALVVTSRVPDPSPRVATMAATYLRFLRDAQRADGRMHNRRTASGAWCDAPSTDDHWGRAVWAFGTAAASSPDDVLAAGARSCAAVAMRARSPYPRAMAYAALGAAQLLRSTPDDVQARELLADVGTTLRRPLRDPSWPWPYGRLTYANAVLPEAMIVVGVARSDEDLVLRGRELLAWLVDQQTLDGHLSVVPAGGRSRGDARPAFDQQPIEVSALAEAGRTAYLATGDERWARVVGQCLAWFEGDNDAGVPVRDAATGGGFDGLEPASVNQNQGAESTLAWLATVQLAHAVDVVDAR